MGDIKLLAVDLDDTLLRSDLTISGRTKAAIRKAEEAGVTVVPASGRVPVSMEAFVRSLGLYRRSGYLISNNGALIQETLSGKVVHEIKLDVAAALAAFDLVDAEDFPVQMYEGDTMYVSRHNEFSEYAKRLTGMQQVVPADFRSMVAAGCHKLLVPGDPVLLAPLENLLRAYLGGQLTLFTSKPYYLELLPANTDKGTALATVAGLLGIGREQIIAIGDSPNDDAMLRWAGLGIAMCNGNERTKAVADLVTDWSNDEDGVARIIEQHILKGR
ncbi:MAG: Cof-type HAD-IIB family hydrolase [Treponema sp.]|nr:Cof-type HAD-IIB family hydrolase [Treponema sp.]